MRICAIICEFNPFHNGHEYLIAQAKRLSGCDAVLCVMSGNFTQRGEICILDKFNRAKHSILGGADCVLELPVSFTVAPAEIFAQGAVKILSSIPEITTLAFGCETADKEKFLFSAHLLLNETKQFSQTLKSNLSNGESYVKSYANAFKSCGGDESFISSPNNILGIEYVKAILKQNVKVDILPIARKGAAYSDGILKQNFSSASAIRKNINEQNVQSNVPPYVYDNLKNAVINQKKFEELCMFELLQADKCNLKNIYGCGEGLENRLKSLNNLNYEHLIAEATDKRYTAARISRILCANLLKLYKPDTEDFLQSDLYLKPLAVNSQKRNEILSSLSKSSYPTVILKNQLPKLSSAAKKCFELSEKADRIWSFINETEIYNYTLLNI